MVVVGVGNFSKLGLESFIAEGSNRLYWERTNYLKIIFRSKLINNYSFTNNSSLGASLASSGLLNIDLMRLLMDWVTFIK